MDTTIIMITEIEIKFAIEINSFLEKKVKEIELNSFDMSNSIVEGLRIILLFKNKGISLKSVNEIILYFYNNYPKTINEKIYNKFDDFYVNFLAETKGPPWCRGVNIWSNSTNAKDIYW